MNHPIDGAVDDSTDCRRDVLLIDGMFCAACAASVEATLARQAGVVRAAVNFVADAAVVEWRPAATRLDDLLASVRALGYRVTTPAGGAAADADNAFEPARDLQLRLVVALFFGMWAMLPTIALYLGAGANSTVGSGLAWAAGLFALPVVAWSGLPFYRMGVATLRSGVAGVDALVTIGCAGAVLLSAIALARGSDDVYFEVAVALITLQLVARLFDLSIRRRGRDAISALLALAPTELSLLDDAGGERRVGLGAVTAGARIRVRPGEAVAVDGVVEEGESLVDSSLLSGESAARAIAAGATVHAGERLLDGALVVRVTAGAGGRRIDALALQVRQLLASRPPWQRLADRIAARFLWLAGAGATTAAAIALGQGEGPQVAAVRALAVFVIACPCALSLAAPLAGMMAAAAGARRGIVLRDLGALTTAAVPQRLFVDKTGTLTVGRPEVVAVHSAPGFDAAAVLALAAAAERDSEHPLARAIRTAAGDVANTAGSRRTIAGRGVSWRAASDGPVVRVGSAAWLEAEGIATGGRFEGTGLSRVMVARDDQLVGAIDLDDALRPGIDAAITALRERGLAPVILSGDSQAAVGRIAARLGLEGYGGLTPEAKVVRIEAARSAGATVAFVGDGLNDGPALAAADLGVAVAGATDVARAAAAITLTRDGVVLLPEVLALTARARAIVRQNLVFALLYNLVAVPGAVFGMVHPVIAAVAMALSSVTIMANSLRAGAVSGRNPPASAASADTPSGRYRVRPTAARSA